MRFLDHFRDREPRIRRATIAALLAVGGAVLALAAISTLNGRGATDGVGVAVELSDPEPRAGAGELGVAATIRNDTDARIVGAITLAVLGPGGELASAEAEGDGLDQNALVTLAVTVDLDVFDRGDELEVHVQVPDADGSLETRVLVVEMR